MREILSVAVATATTIVLLWGLLRSRVSMRIQDVPNARSLHATPTPRIGGIGLLGGVAAGWMFCIEALEWWQIVPLLLLAGISILDDMKGLAVYTRLMVQLAAAAMLVAGSGLWSGQGWLSGVLVLFIAVWMINLYNFMDGSDGLAGGMAMFGFLFCGVAAMMADNAMLAIQCFVVSAAAAGFLIFNFPPAKVFMGDAGSIPLGFIVAALGLMGWQQGCWEYWFPILVFSPFLMDAGVTLIRRSLRGAHITEAHREHYYQRAVQMGYGHKKVALAEYLLMATVGGSALLAMGHGRVVEIFVIWMLIYIAIMQKMDRSWAQYIKALK